MATYTCNDCPSTFEDREGMERHMSETMPKDGGQSHRISGGMPPGPTRSDEEREVARVMEEALDRALEDLQRFVDKGTVTEEQVTAMLSSWPDFQEAWENYLAENE